MPDAIREMRRLGQSPWLDFIRRAFIESGELERYIRDGWLTGLTSNPTIFGKAISGSTDYDEALALLARSGIDDPYEGFISLARDDIRAAADLFRPVYDDAGGADGLVSHELPPGVEDDVQQILDETRRLWSVMDRPNVMIKVPGTAAGVEAVEQLTAEGINVNITLLFNVERYVEIAEAYVRGLERRLEAGEPVDRVASVASFFVSRVDSKVDDRLPAESPLRGSAGIANARIAYARFREIFSGDRWQRLADAGARVQRTLWASTSTKNPDYRDVMYVEGLLAPDAVNTMPEATLKAFADHGAAQVAITDESIEAARRTMDELAEAGIDMDRVTAELLEEGKESFARDFRALLECVQDALRVGANRWVHAGGELHQLGGQVQARLDRLGDDEVIRRIWNCDHGVWRDDPEEIANRLGWLQLPDLMEEEAPRLEAFARGIADEGYRTAVLLGMGGSSLAPEVMARTFGTAEGMLELLVLSTTDPDAVRSLAEGLDFERTLFVVSSKSGTTIEVRALLDYFWERLPDGRHFVAVTDAGTPLETLGHQRGFRRVFAQAANQEGCNGAANVGGRYSALTDFGLLPAALSGAPITAMLERAREMREACDTCVPLSDNPGAWLGAVMGEAARSGRDKLTLLANEEIEALGAWIEQLIAESTGKDGTGILPVVGEPPGPPEVYGDDRLFVVIGDGAGVDAIESAGYPVVRLPYRDREQLGAEFFRWEFATAVAGHVLGVHPFDQPNVQQAKDATARILEGEEPRVETPSADELLESLRAGDYVSILAFAPPSPELDATLRSARLRLRDRYRVATTAAYGPSYLHSTGQIHKGGPNTGVFLWHLSDGDEDLTIPGREFGFRGLERAQALGDLAALQAAGRRVARVGLEELQVLAGERS